MFCQKCGKPVDDGQIICPECASPDEQYIQDPTVGEIPVPEEYLGDNFTLNTEGSIPPRRSKKGLVIGIIAAAAVIAIAAVVLLWDSILGLFGVMKFDTPQEHFAYVEKQSITQFTEAFSTAYELTRTNSDGTKDTSAEVDVHLLLGDELIDMAEMSLSSEDMAVELDFLKDICLELDVGTADSMYQYDLGIGLADVRVLTLSYLGDASKNVNWLTVPEITDQYLEMDPAEMGGDTVGTMEDSLTANARLREMLPSKENLDSLVDKYLKIILGHITEVEKTAQTVQIDGVSQELTVLTAKVGEETVLNICIDLLEAVKTDEIIKSFVVNLGEYTNQQAKDLAEEYGEEYDPVDAYAEFTESVDSGLEELRGYLADADPANYIVITDYVDKKQRIVGKEFYVASKDEAPIEIRFLTVSQKDQFALRFNADTFGVEGGGTNTDGVVNGTYTIITDGVQYAKLVLEDAAADKGTFRLEPSATLIDAFAEDSGLGSMLSLVDVALELEYALAEQETSLALKVLAGDKLLVGLTTDGAAGDEIAPVAPEKAVSVMDQEALMELVTELDISKVITNLENAGVPEDYVLLVQYLLEAYINELTYYGY